MISGNKTKEIKKLIIEHNVEINNTVLIENDSISYTQFFLYEYTKYRSARFHIEMPHYIDGLVKKERASIYSCVLLQHNINPNAMKVETIAGRVLEFCSFRTNLQEMLHVIDNFSHWSNPYCNINLLDYDAPGCATKGHNYPNLA